MKSTTLVKIQSPLNVRWYVSLLLVKKKKEKKKRDVTFIPKKKVDAMVFNIKCGDKSLKDYEFEGSDRYR